MRTKKLIHRILFCALIFIAALFVVSLIPEQAASDSLPTGKIIADASHLWSPGKIAVDGDGTLYVVDGYKNRVQKFDAKGSYLGQLNIPRPSAVAVAPDGALYIGSHHDYSVAVYSRGEIAGYLGSGKNEFSSIRDIAVDEGTGDVFVADTVGNLIRVYDASRKLKKTLSGFTAPAGIVARENIYILDAPLIPCPDSISVKGTLVRIPDDAGACTGSRISVLDRKGNLIRSIRESGGEHDHMTRPVALAVDKFGNIYVADALRRAILAYDALGAYIGAMTTITDDLRTPASVAISREGGLYVSSSGTRSIVEIGLTGAVHFGQNGSIDFKSTTGAALSRAALGY